MAQKHGGGSANVAEMISGSRYRLLMVGSILVVLLNAWVAWHALGSLLNAQGWLAHTLEVLMQAEETSVAMSASSNAARAFLITGAPMYESRYEQAKQEAWRDVDNIARLTADNRSQQQRIPVVRQRMMVRWAAQEKAMRLKAASPAETVPKADVQTALSDSPDGGISVKYALAQVANEERRLVADRYAEANAAKHEAMISFVAATVLDLLLIVVAFQQLGNARRDREQLASRASEIFDLNARLSGVNAELSSLNADLEQRVEERTRELEVSNQELQAFSYSVSHDLRAPLRTIDGFSLALAEDFAEVLNAEGRDYIQRVRGGVQRMGMLIDALLQLSRVTRSEVQRETVDLSQLATLVFGELAVNEAGRKVSFEAEPGMVAEADPRLMRVAFENLLGNALKFTSKRADAEVCFGTVTKGNETVYFIRDNGAGFDMRYVDRLFTAFQRLHGDRDFKGSGIGLATVSRIIRRHHGRIWAEGEIGAGATFYFTLSS